MFAPNAWDELSKQPALATTTPRFREPDPIDEIVARDSSHAATTRVLIEILFRTNATSARAERRVAHPSVFKMYLERARPGTVTPATAVDEALALSNDGEVLGDYLAGFNPAQVEDLIERLADQVDGVEPINTGHIIAAVFNQLPRLREEERGMLDFGVEISVARFALRALEQLPDEAQRVRAIEDALSRIKQLSGRLELVQVVGHRENVGAELVPADVAALVEATILDEAIENTDPGQLANERRLWDLFYWHFKTTNGQDSERLRQLCDDDAVFVRLLRSRLYHRMQQSVGAVAIHREPALPWDTLVEMLGEEYLRSRLSAFKADGLTDDRDVLAVATARKYATGELPSRDWRSTET